MKLVLDWRCIVTDLELYTREDMVTECGGVVVGVEKRASEESEESGKMRIKRKGGSIEREMGALVKSQLENREPRVPQLLRNLTPTRHDD
jgi:hypothetical protein